MLARVVDEPGAGGANHEYEILGPKEDMPEGKGRASLGYVHFQNGPIKEVGVNGTTHEAELAILLDRLRAFQAGPYACRENAIALTKGEEMLMWLQRRTIARIKRGVEGTHKK